MRRKDRETDAAFAWNVADKCEYAVMAMTLADNTPYCVPLSIARKNETLYFHCAKEGKKADALRKNPKVCLVCVGDTHRMEDKFSTEYESAVLFGVAEEVTGDGEKIEALRLICERHTPINMANFETAIRESLKKTAVWRIAVSEITGKRKSYKEK